MRFNILTIAKTIQCCANYYLKGKPHRPGYTPFKILPDIIHNRLYTKKEVVKMIGDFAPDHSVHKKTSQKEVSDDSISIITEEVDHYTGQEVVSFLNQFGIFTYYSCFDKVAREFLGHHYRGLSASTIDDYYFLMDRAVLDVDGSNPAIYSCELYLSADNLYIEGEEPLVALAISDFLFGSW